MRVQAKSGGDFSGRLVTFRYELATRIVVIHGEKARLSWDVHVHSDSSLLLLGPDLGTALVHYSRAVELHALPSAPQIEQ
jgi:hypothetical protein